VVENAAVFDPLQDVEDRLVHLGGLLYDHNFADAHKKSSSLLWTVRVSPFPSTFNGVSSRPPCF
jgi:hypothetical protein